MISKRSKERAEVPKFQRASDVMPDRTDHVWTKVVEVVDGVTRDLGWKCVTCGAVTTTTPPDFPTPKDWVPHHHERLTDFERDLCKMKGK